MPKTLDKLDRQILEHLQRGGSPAARDTADAVGSSKSVVQRRIKKLTDEGVILERVAVVDPQKCGPLMTFLVEVEIERERVDLLDDCRRSVLRLEEVQQCYYVTGSTDFMLVVVTKDMDSFEALSRQVFTENPNIRRFETKVVVGRVKASLRIPLCVD